MDIRLTIELSERTAEVLMKALAVVGAKSELSYTLPVAEAPVRRLPPRIKTAEAEPAQATGFTDLGPDKEKEEKPSAERLKMEGLVRKMLKERPDRRTGLKELVATFGVGKVSQIPEDRIPEVVRWLEA